MAMKDSLRALAVCLALGLLQMLALCAWLWQQGDQAPLWLRLCSLSLLVLTALLCAMGASRLRRLLLWRRRRSPRPSREVQAERRRIAADLHDGVGGLLVNAMALLEPSETRQRQAQELLEQALLDLRLLVDAMDAVEDALPVRLARLRHRLQPVLDRRGMQIRWSVADPQSEPGLPDLPDLPRGQSSQHLLAITQEAVSNVLQHTDALELWITLAADEQWKSASNVSDASFVHARLSIEDAGPVRPADGRQIPGLASAGMGWVNMRRRALVMGAKLSISARPGGGTSVTLNW